MQLTIKHNTIYQFDEAVFLEPHFLRFKPACDPYLTITDFQLNVSPQPIGISEQMDVENNVFHFCWFEGLHKELKVSAEARIITEPFNPFNYLIYPASFSHILSFDYPDHLKNLLQPSLTYLELSKEMKAYLDDLMEIAGTETSVFILELTKEIHKTFKVESREEGDPRLPKETFKLKNGSCRDLTWMQIHLLRHLGIASRFVSGYFYLDAAEPAFELHAWLETYIPGAGWIGYDPSHGIAVGHTHIPVAKCAHYKNTMPIIGTVRGKGVASLNFSLEISLDD
ncbi:transglutaminase family protein [Ekhidna sp. To15]|uniref:transglutaminase family protein n=1 Tax=Ekhidna sp. To15 TaxID=3395267 RepID=UPI003F5233D3